MDNETTAGNGAGMRVVKWVIFIVVIALVIWGLIAANQKAARIQGVGIPLPSEVTSADWMTGNLNASTTLVEYSDFQCPACGLYYPILKRLLAEHGNDFRFVYRHFPLPQHNNAFPAAIAAEAAGKQGKFWEMHDMLFDTQSDWEATTTPNTFFTGYAKTLGLDVDRFKTDIEDKDRVLYNKINASSVEGTKGGINSTPTFFVNGKKINNPNNVDEFAKILTNPTQ